MWTIGKPKKRNYFHLKYSAAKRHLKISWVDYITSEEIFRKVEKESFLKL